MIYIYIYLKKELEQERETKIKDDLKKHSPETREASLNEALGTPSNTEKVHNK